MDAGWAAVIAGASGAGGAALAAWATGRAMIRQARLEAENGFSQWLRERRQDAYAGLLASCDAVHDALNPIIRDSYAPLPSDERATAWRAVNAALSGVARSARAVAVVGPAHITSTGVAMRDALHTVVNVWRDPNSPAADARAINYATAMSEWEESVVNYLAAVQRVLQHFNGDAPHP